VERDFAARRKAEEVEHNYRFIDDILSLTACIPPEEDYAMQYKSTRPKEGELVYLGMELKWLEHKGTTKFITGIPRHGVSHQNPEVPGGRIHDHRLPAPRGYHRPVHPRTTAVLHIARVQNCGARGGIGQHAQGVPPQGVGQDVGQVLGAVVEGRGGQKR
jgi:hypothetical protein